MSCLGHVMRMLNAGREEMEGLDVSVIHQDIKAAGKWENVKVRDTKAISMTDLDSITGSVVCLTTAG